MARKPKDVFSYPQVLFTTVEAVALRCAEVSMTAESLAKARKLRSQFYAFRQGLSTAIMRGLANPGTIEAEQVERLQNTLQFARCTVCWFDEAEAKKSPLSSVKVTYMNKDQTPFALALTEALAKAEGTTAAAEPQKEDAAEAERTARELAKLVGGKDEDDDKDNPYY